MAAVIRALICLLLLTLTAHAGEVTTVSLRTGARVSGEGPITLGMIAELTGPLAGSLDGLVVEPEPGQLLDGQGAGSVTIQRVRELVLEATPESAVSLQGTACEIRSRRGLAARATTLGPIPQTPSSNTLRDQVEAHLQAMFGVRTDSIKIAFEDRDEALLRTAIDGRVVEVRAMGSGRKIPLSVTVYDGPRILAEGTVRVEVSLKRSVVVLSQDLARGVTVSADQFRTEERWVGTDDDSCTPEEAIGQMTRRRVRVGETLTSGELEPPIVISRGDIVMVRSIRGAAVVQLRARAMGDGRVGETIELEQTSGRDGRGGRSRLIAQVLGPGRALIGPAEPQGKP